MTSKGETVEHNENKRYGLNCYFRHYNNELLGKLVLKWYRNQHVVNVHSDHVKHPLSDIYAAEL